MFQQYYSTVWSRVNHTIQGQLWATPTPYYWFRKVISLHGSLLPAYGHASFLNIQCCPLGQKRNLCSLISSSSGPSHTLQLATIFFHIISYTSLFPKKCFHYKMCSDFLYKNSLKHFIKKKRDLINNIRKSSCQRAFFFPDLTET
jgi:hypothetical protein